MRRLMVGGIRNVNSIGSSQSVKSIACANCGKDHLPNKKQPRCDDCMDVYVRAAKVNAAAVKRRKELER